MGRGQNTAASGNSLLFGTRKVVNPFLAAELSDTAKQEWDYIVESFADKNQEDGLEVLKAAYKDNKILMYPHVKKLIDKLAEQFVKTQENKWMIYDDEDEYKAEHKHHVQVVRKAIKKQFKKAPADAEQLEAKFWFEDLVPHLTKPTMLASRVVEQKISHFIRKDGANKEAARLFLNQLLEQNEGVKDLILEEMHLKMVEGDESQVGLRDHTREVLQVFGIDTDEFHESLTAKYDRYGSFIASTLSSIRNQDLENKTIQEIQSVYVDTWSKAYASKIADRIFKGAKTSTSGNQGQVYSSRAVWDTLLGPEQAFELSESLNERVVFAPTKADVEQMLAWQLQDIHSPAEEFYQRARDVLAHESDI